MTEQLMTEQGELHARNLCVFFSTAVATAALPGVARPTPSNTLSRACLPACSGTRLLLRHPSHAARHCSLPSLSRRKTRNSLMIITGGLLACGSCGMHVAVSG